MSITMHTVAKANTRIIRLQGGGLRFLDAHEIPQKDFQVVTRPFQGFDTTQHWRITDTGNGSTIQQVSSGRFLDAHEIEELDFRVVTRRNRTTTRSSGTSRTSAVASSRFSR